MASTIIATREIYSVDDKANKLILEVCAPERTASGNSWECEVRLVGAPEELAKIKGGGTDSYQALLIGLSLLETNVARFNRDLGGKLRFLDDSQADLDLRIP